MNEDVVLYGYDYFSYYFYLLYYKFIGFPLAIRICVAVVTMCTILYFLLALYLSYGVVRRRNDKRRYKRIRDRYYDQMKDIALNPVRLSREEIIEMLDCEKKRLKKRETWVVVQLMMEIKTEMADKINEHNRHGISEAFKLPTFFERELQFGRMKEKVKVLKAIQTLEEYVSEAVLVRLLSHRKLEMRKAARICYTWLSQNAPFRFFDEDINLRLTMWDRIEFHNVFKYREQSGFVMPNFMRWVDRIPDEGVKTFLIKEITFFDQRENCPVLEKRLSGTREVGIRSEIIRTLGALKYTEAELQLTQGYSVQPEDVKRSIIQAIVEMNTGRSVDFLREAYEIADSRETKRTAIEGLYRYGDAGRTMFESLEAKASDDVALLFAHVKNPLINNNKRA